MTDPYIEILEQPQHHARFRYCSEGEHGYLYGEKSTKTLPTYPTVQLVNYKGEAHIRCELYQADKNEKHPHELKFYKQENQIDYLVPVNGSYTVYFEKLSFINKSSNSFSKELRAQYMDANPGAREREVNKCCKRVIQSIDFNKVRLKFSAHDVQTDEEICHVYSRPILNSKSPDTNELRIVRVTKTFGSARGTEEITLLVEKISNKNTKVRFLDEKGEWSAIAHPIYKHHQFAIVCSIPPYKDQKIAHSVNVFIELFRETDGATSNRVPFRYVGLPHLAARGRKRTFTESASDVMSEGESLNRTTTVAPIKIKKRSWTPRVCEVPVSQQCWSADLQIPEQEITQQDFTQCMEFPEAAQNDHKAELTGQNSDTDSGIQENVNDLSTILEEYLFSSEASHLDALMQWPTTVEEIMLPEHSVEDEDFPILHKNPVLSEAAQMLRITARPAVTQPYEKELYSLHHQTLDIPECFDPDNINETLPFQTLMPDSAQRKEHKGSESEKLRYQSTRPRILNIKNGHEIPNNTVGELLEKEKIKELVQHIIILIKQNGPKSALQTKLEHLFELDLPNGDTFLHMAINWPIFSLLVKTLHVVNMTDLLNTANDLYQTVLHLAVLNELADTVRMLVSKGCDPLLPDFDGNNAIHLAVTSYPTLAALLDAMAVNKVPYDVNVTNYENRTALHVATIFDGEASLRLLLKNGADVGARDEYGRTALHLAACHDRARALSVLLDYVDDCDVDATDCRGQTALQTACDGDVRENTLAIIQLLLQAKADPTKCEGNTASAMKLAKRHPEMRLLILRYQHTPRLEDSEDEYHTADEGENGDCIASKLQGLKINELQCY